MMKAFPPGGARPERRWYLFPLQTRFSPPALLGGNMALRPLNVTASDGSGRRRRAMEAEEWRRQN